MPCIPQPTYYTVPKYLPSPYSYLIFHILCSCRCYPVSLSPPFLPPFHWSHVFLLPPPFILCCHCIYTLLSPHPRVPPARHSTSCTFFLLGSDIIASLGSDIYVLLQSTFLTLLLSAPLRFAPLRSASLRFAPLRSSSLRSAWHPRPRTVAANVLQNKCCWKNVVGGVLLEDCCWEIIVGGLLLEDCQGFSKSLTVILKMTDRHFQNDGQGF